MAKKVSFESTPDTGTPVEEQPKTNTDTTVATRADHSLSAPSYTRDDDAEGEFTPNDIARPKLAIVAKTGKLSNIFTPGDMVLNQEYVIGTQKAPLDVIPIAIKKLYQNDLDFDGGEMGETVATAVEVTNRGGVVDYRPYDEKDATHYWKPVLQVVFLIKRPENVAPEAAMFFPFTIDGSDYTVAGFWASSKSAWNGVAQALILAKKKEGNVRRSAYQLTTKGESTKDGKRSWIQTTLRRTGETPAGIAKFLIENPVSC